MNGWTNALKKFKFDKKEVDIVFLDEIQFMDTNDTLSNVETILNNGIEFSAIYFAMLLSLFFMGGGRFVSIDYWLKRNVIKK